MTAAPRFSCQIRNLKGSSAIATADDQLDALLDAAVDGMILIEPSGRVARFNAAAERMFGYAAAEVVGHNVNMLMPKPYHDEHDQYLKRYLSTAQPHVIGTGREVMGQHRDGSTFPIHLSVGEFKHGSERGFVGIVHDITMRKRREDELRTKSEQLLLIFESTPTAIAITDNRGRVISTNLVFQKLVGYAADDLIGYTFPDMLELLVADDARPHLPVETSTFEKCTASLSHDVPLSHDVTICRDAIFRAKDGHSVHGALYTGAACGPDGQPLFLVSQIIDRSAVHAAEQEAEQLRARLSHVNRVGTMGEMVSGIAHEVNQPLTAIATYANGLKRLLRSGRAEPAEIAETLEKIAAQAERAGQVIQGLRKLTRRHEAESTGLNCNALIREVSRLIEFELRFSEHALLLQLDPGDPMIRGDGVQFQQVILNLIRNALEAMKDAAQPGVVTVRTFVDAEDFVEILVMDSGPGLSVEMEAHLFEPFFTTKPQGMGLGLSICRSIVSALGGQIRYRRGGAGGAEFVFRLPRVQQ